MTRIHACTNRKLLEGIIYIPPHTCSRVLWPAHSFVYGFPTACFFLCCVVYNLITSADNLYSFYLLNNLLLITFCQCYSAIDNYKIVMTDHIEMAKKANKLFKRHVFLWVSPEIYKWWFIFNKLQHQ